MISMLQGTVLDKNENEITLMTVAGIGFRLTCSYSTVAALPSSDSTVKLYTYMNVRDDGVDLFGFLAKEEKELFKRLISVSGVGPKIAIAILGSMSLSDLRLAILTGDDAALCRAPGIGKKTAQRIALELKDKLKDDIFESADAVTAAPIAPADQDAVSEALLALKSLGYSQQEASAALRGLQTQGTSADELIRLALRRMVQNA